ncbi:MAG: hypothetical protein GQ524_01980 [Anaerolineales bacterium]|nr:hypothetical protein [Anaerolineales bacterium]
MPDASVKYTDQPEGLQRTPDYIRERYLKAKEAMRPLHSRIEKYRNLYNFHHYLKAPKAGERRIEWPDYTNAVDLAVSILSSNEIDFRAYGFTPGSAEGKRSSIIEKVLNAAIHISQIRDEIDLNHEHTLQLARDGVSVIRTVWDDEYHEMFLEDKTEPENDDDDGEPIYGEFTDLPLRVQVLDAKNLYVVPGGKKRWLSLFYAEERTIADVESDEGITIPEFVSKSKEERETEKHDFIDYWEYVDAFELVEDDEGNPIPIIDPETYVPAVGDDGETLYQRRPVKLAYNGTIYGENFIRPLEHAEGYNAFPYTIFFWKPIGRLRPVDWGESILHVMQYIVPHMETRFNRQTRMVDLYSSLPLVTRTEGARKIKLDPGMGRVAQLSLEEELGFPTWPGSPPDVSEQLGILQAKIQESSFPSAMYGEGVSNMAGYAISQLIDSGQVRLTTPIRQLEQGWAVWAHKTLSLIKNFAENAEIHVYGPMRGKFFYDKVVGRKCHGIRVDVKVDAKYPGMDTRQIAEATQAKPFMPLRYIHERYLDIQQSDDAIRLMDIEKIKEMPAFQELVMMEYLSELAEKENNKIALQLLQRYMNQGMPEQPGRPSEGPSPPALTGGSTPIVPGAYPVEEGGTPFGQEPNRAMEELVTVAPNMAGGFS